MMRKKNRVVILGITGLSLKEAIICKEILMMMKERVKKQIT